MTANLVTGVRGIEEQSFQYPSPFQFPWLPALTSRFLSVENRHSAFLAWKFSSD